jgi:spectinomycin phosphotransferase
VCKIDLSGHLGDLHPRNLIRDHAGKVFVIDWDEVMLAPKERDFIFVRPPTRCGVFSGLWTG